MPVAARAHGSPHAEKPLPKSLRFASRELRALFVDAWLEAPLRQRRTWSQINFVLAEESLRQATAQMRHLPAEGLENAYAYRRVVQAIYHGLTSLDLSADAFVTRGSAFGNLYGPMLPNEPEKRFRYLYTFLYRHCVENNEWRLGRAFGRSDLRLDLLSLFMFPGKGTRMLAEVSHDPNESLFPEPDRPETSDPDHCAFLAHDRYLRCELLEAIGRAATDLGAIRGGPAVRWVLSMLPPQARAAANAMLPERGLPFSAIENSALKLRIDWNQSLGTETELATARALCLEQLDRHGLDASALAQAQAELQGVLKRTFENTPGVTDTLRACLDRLVDKVQTAVETSTGRRACAEILLHLGEIYATEADNADFERRGQSGTAGSATDQGVALLFARACAVYWLGDRIRSSVGAMTAPDVRWPLAGARGMRYYVRVCLKLARLVSAGGSGAENRRMTDLANALLEHAQSRIGVYTRHQFQFPRERVAMLLLEASRIRAWVLVGLAGRQPQFVARDRALAQAQVEAPTRAKGGTSAGSKRAQLAHDFVRFIEEQQSILDDSVAFLDEAENLLVSLGFQPALVRRLLLDRVKHATAAARLLGAFQSLSALVPDHQKVLANLIVYARCHLRIAQHALSTLRGISVDNAFWREIARRQQASLDRAIAVLPK